MELAGEVYLGRKILLCYGEGALELRAGGQAILTELASDFLVLQGLGLSPQCRA